MNKTCETCEHWRPRNDLAYEDWGTCEFPLPAWIKPQVEAVKSHVIMSGNPVNLVHQSQHCGLHSSSQGKGDE